MCGTQWRVRGCRGPLGFSGPANRTRALLRQSIKPVRLEEPPVMRVSSDNALGKKRPGMFATLWAIARAAGSIEDDKANDNIFQRRRH
jgi:hypothetical protein